jgi:hypothetical protein
VPLPRQALELLQTRQAGGAGGVNADDLVFVNTRGNKLTHWDQPTKRVQSLSHTSGWHRHDIRRTSATLMGELGIAPHVIEIALNHTMSTSSDGSTVGRIAQVYNRSRYRPEHAAALQRLADELERIEADDGKVVRLRA